MAGIGVIVAYYLLNAALYVLFAALTLPEVFRPQMDLNDKLGAVIGKIRPSHPVRSLAIWGWAPSVYVLTGLPPAVRDVCNQAGVRTQPDLLGYYRHRFVRDMRSALPDLFIDAVAPGQILWNWKESDRYESNPELKNYIDDNYVLVDQLALVPGAKPVRFFARRENAAVQQQAPTRLP